jgi:hypothetical protein
MKHTYEKSEKHAVFNRRKLRERDNVGGQGTDGRRLLTLILMA